MDNRLLNFIWFAPVLIIGAFVATVVGLLLLGIAALILYVPLALLGIV